MEDAKWLDLVLAVPAIGIDMAPWLGFASGIWDTLERLSDRWEGANIQANSPAKVRIEKPSGLFLDLTPMKMLFGYTYQLRLVDAPGKLPTLSEPASPARYHAMLGELVNECSALLSDVFQKKQCTVVRLGAVAECRLVEDQSPPGVARYVEALDGLWRKPLRTVDADFVVETQSSTSFREQCHHTVSKNAYDRPGDLRIKLDWQHVRTPPSTHKSAEVAELVQQTVSRATEYFEEFGVAGGCLCQD